MSTDTRIRDTLVSVSSTSGTDLGTLLEQVQSRARTRARRRRVGAVAACAVLLVAGSAVVLSLETSSSDRGPTVSVQPADPSETPVAVPNLIPDASMVIDRIEVGGGPIASSELPVAYTQILATSPTLQGPRLVIDMTELGPTQPELGTCERGSNPTTGEPLPNVGTAVSVADHDACLAALPDGPNVSWNETGRIRVSLQASGGLSNDDVLAVARALVRRSNQVDGFTIQGALPAGLSEVMSGPYPPNYATSVSFHQGACTYDLQVGGPNPLWFSSGGSPTPVNGQPGLLLENMLTWNPVNGATARLVVNEDGMQSGAVSQILADCDPVGVASRLAQVDSATWEQTLTNLGDRVRHVGGG